jgi:hypothetical protein
VAQLALPVDLAEPQPEESERVQVGVYAKHSTYLFAGSCRNASITCVPPCLYVSICARASHSAQMSWLLLPANLTALPKSG